MIPPDLALLIWFVLLVALLCFDPARVPETSVFLWVPVIWMFIVASRLPSQWLGFRVASQSQAYLNGNPLDRVIWTGMILVAIAVLVSRQFRWGDFVRHNFALVAFIAFALLSVFWSSFPFVTFKRWSRDLGDYVVILVVLSDPRPLEAVRTVLRRLAYLLVPLSIVMIKYFPHLSRLYAPWNGRVMYTGAATSKNMLGAICLVSGLFFFWDTVSRWPQRKDQQTRRILLVNAALFAMTLYLLRLAHSATSSTCLALGCLVIAMAHSKLGKRHPSLPKIVAPAGFITYLILTLGLGMTGTLNRLVGRKANFTDRTLIWKTLLGMHTNPLLGTGYEAFWLGPRLHYVWGIVGVHINEAHDGYLGVYLEVGLIGLFLLCAFLVTAYKNGCRTLDSGSSLGSLFLALWTTLVFYNVTEQSFENSILWTTFLLAALTVPSAVKARVWAAPSFDMSSAEDVPSSPYEMAAERK